jgi:hypothetical protein
MNSKRKLYYDLVPSSVLGKEAPYFARTGPVRTVGREELISIMARANTTITRQDVLGVLDLLEEQVVSLLLQGFAVDTGLFSVRVNLRGGFRNQTDKFDPRRHSLHLKLGGAPGFKKRVLDRLTPVRKKFLSAHPLLKSVTDYVTGSRNNLITPGGLAEIKGRGLLLDPDREDCGFFLVAEKESSGRIKSYRHQTVERLTERTALIRLPDSLPAGRYRLEARKQYMEGTVTGSLGGTLTAADGESGA